MLRPRKCESGLGGGNSVVKGEKICLRGKERLVAVSRGEKSVLSRDSDGRGRFTRPRCPKKDTTGWGGMMGVG